MKTHRGAAKRFKRTGTGKLRQRRAMGTHNLAKKRSKRKRALRSWQPVSKAEQKKVSRLIPYGMD